MLAASSSSSSTKASAGSTLVSFLFLAVIFGAGYFFFIRPRSQAARRQRDTLMEISVGDEVLTGAGIFGRVLDVEPDRVTLETAPGTRITVLRSTIARRITNETAADAAGQHWDDDDEDDAHEAYDDYLDEGGDEDHEDGDEHDVAVDEDMDEHHEDGDEHDVAVDGDGEVEGSHEAEAADHAGTSGESRESEHAGNGAESPAEQSGEDVHDESRRRRGRKDRPA